MKKVKLFFVAAALCLLTVGVFAGKKTFTTYVLYGYSSPGGTPTYTPLANGTGFDPKLTNVSIVTLGTASSPINFTSSAHGTETVVAYNAGTYFDVNVLF